MFFFLIYLFYNMSIFLTVNNIPTPSFLFYTPSMHEIFLGIQILGIPILFLIFYFLSSKSSVIGLVIAYIVMLILSFFFPFASFILALIGSGLFISVISSATSIMSKILWGVSSIYLPLVIFAIPFYSVFIIPSIIASGIEIFKMRNDF